VSSACSDRSSCPFRFQCEIQHKYDEVCLRLDLQKKKEDNCSSSSVAETLNAV
jgi:hypothetical protein